MFRILIQYVWQDSNEEHDWCHDHVTVGPNDSDRVRE
jgi:hypothetical protein